MDLAPLRALAEELEASSGDNAYQARENKCGYKRVECKRMSEEQLRIAKKIREIVAEEFEGGRIKT